MSAATRIARSAAATVRSEGEQCVFTPSVGSPVTCFGVLDGSTEALDVFGDSGERRWTAWLPAAAITARPTTGDLISTDAGDWYAVDGDAELMDGLWRCLLTPSEAPILMFVQLLSADGAGLAAANGDVLGVGNA